MDLKSQTSIHIEALQELGDSLEASLEQQSIELEDRTIILTGSVTEQSSSGNSCCNRFIN